MKYKLLIKSESSEHQLMCSCGKCEPAIFIDESMKEEFQRLMGWDETEFIRRTIVVNEVEELEEGCGKECYYSDTNITYICRKQPKGVFIEAAANITKDGADAIKKVVDAPKIEFAICQSCERKIKDAKRGGGD